MKLLTASERQAEARGPKILIAGVPGVGKTSLLNTTAPEALSTMLFVDSEAGDLAVVDLRVDSIRPRTWPEYRDLAAIVGGSNPALPASVAYSQAHFDAVSANPAMAELARHSVVFVDSLTEISRVCRGWAELQPESVTDRGKKDLRGTYGLVARELIGWLQQMQHAREKTVVLVAVLEKVTDDFGVSTWGVQLEGQRTGRELPAIVDEVISMHFVDFGDGKPVRAFVCTSPNAWSLPAKDRSGKLAQVEEPHLGKLLAKLSPPKVSEAKSEVTGE